MSSLSSPQNTSEEIASYNDMLDNTRNQLLASSDPDVIANRGRILQEIDQWKSEFGNVNADSLSFTAITNCSTRCLNIDTFATSLLGQTMIPNMEYPSSSSHA